MNKNKWNEMRFSFMNELNSQEKEWVASAWKDLILGIESNPSTEIEREQISAGGKPRLKLIYSFYSAFHSLSQNEKGIKLMPKFYSLEMPESLTLFHWISSILQFN